MGVPEEVRKVPRPKNTVVYVYGENKYGVRERSGYYTGGKCPPKNGKCIGHIINLEYVPLPEETIEPVSKTKDYPDMLDWANVALCDDLFKDILAELDKVFNSSDSRKIYCISVLRACYGGIKDYELREHYQCSYLSQRYPGVALSKNIISDFFENLGKTYSKIVQFMRNRASNVKIDHRLLIDGTLKSNESYINSFSDFSRKAKLKGSRDISILFAFDFDEYELVCSKCFPGNMLDINAYETFLQETNIERGLIVSDKGIPGSAASKYFANHPELGYLNPIKRNAKVIKKYKLYEYEGILEGEEEITYKKAKDESKDVWYYSFRDATLAANEEITWLKNHKGESYNDQKLFAKRPEFGTIVLESAKDMLPKEIYQIYVLRWEIELLMRYYKCYEQLDETREHNDYSVLGSEFCNFLATMLTMRLVKKFDSLKLLNDYPFKKLMSILKRSKKVNIGDDDGFKLVKLLPSYEEILVKLGLLD